MAAAALVPGLSLVAKFAPREAGNKATDRALAAALADRLAPGEVGRRADYRKRVAAINKALGTVEVRMCASPGEWSSIAPGAVPGRALRKYAKAFVNQPVPGEEGMHTSRPAPLVVADRVACAAHFRDYLGRAARGEKGVKVKAADVVYPHELVREAMTLRGSRLNRDNADTATAELLEAQWRSLVERAQAKGALGRMLPMCDVSSSMSGTPMEVSIALGLLIAECSAGAFARQVLTFESTPRLVELTADSFVGRVEQLAAAPWGGTTNFQAAMDLVLRTLAEQRVEPGDEPTHLVVLTDMGFDEASGQGYSRKRDAAFETHYQMAQRAFAELGKQVHGAGAPTWGVPLIINWNLRAEYEVGGRSNLQARAEERGVLQISSWAPAMLDAIIEAGDFRGASVELLRQVLDNERYDGLRARLHALRSPAAKAEAAARDAADADIAGLGDAAPAAKASAKRAAAAGAAPPPEQVELALMAARGAAQGAAEV